MDASIESSFFKRKVNASLHLLGEFQAQNAATASLVIKTVFKDMDEDLIERGLSKASLPARFEIISGLKSFGGIKAVVLDGAHTVNSVRYTMDTFRKVFGCNTAREKAVLLFACAADKDAEDIAPCFKDSFDSVFLTKPGFVKESDLPRLDKAFDSACIPHVSDYDCEKSIRAAFEKANSNHSLLLVTGSFYLIAEVRKLMSL